MMNITAKILISIILLFVSLPIPLKAQLGNVNQNAEVKPKLVILGTYHMATTTSNVINIEVDDITSPHRQEQLIELIEKLEKFNPTKIALECNFENNDRIHKRFNDYRAGSYELTRNEIDQIGFRLAKKLSHKEVYCIDWGIWPDDPLYNYETYSQHHPDLKEYLGELYKDNEDIASRMAKNIASRSIIENLIAMNQPEEINSDHQGYFNLLRIGRGDEYVGANYLSWWYGRNLKILSNIIRFTESPEDRILVVYGAGHNKLLNQLAIESAFYDVETPLKYLED